MNRITDAVAREEATQLGIDCTAAVRNAGGDDHDVLVDVHSNMRDLKSALDLTRRLEPLNLFWMEEVSRPFDILAAVNRVAKMPTAGGESIFGVSGYTPYLEAGAVDIVMPIGTPVLAARNVTVMDVEEDFNAGGTNKEKYVERANRVVILHDDGTMGVNAHIDLASVTVRPGLQVRAGRQIARSGNTGFSSGPHLHYVVQQNIGMEIISVPFRFRRADMRPANSSLANAARSRTASSSSTRRAWRSATSRRFARQTSSNQGIRSLARRDNTSRCGAR